ncbi:hypothetical protein MHAE_04800 [Mycobacterium haemophilum DSM 44634]|uniref:Uncharacterized protein n=1 Tax=Mycobacterium haemophilum TaxID=29311 RepID=A0A0I9TAK6_9MYCO|nr:hypothetical protein B586_13845 [Mycobacterium haemophilum DSM 44634]KLO26136.1 hypothetical protein ABH39_18515 [Mycobacterium haemophilum]KLO34503.1 hypothetical protein ABH38_18540 [Mycobacterium haemophilum]KLO37897.1 hypothetical protein ABH37_18835 [Mycobacterium haemophilum]KLO46242.1 hypothetical protein ABH36_18245 [Mycobacterium haemophilum]
MSMSEARQDPGWRWVADVGSRHGQSQLANSELLADERKKPRPRSGNGANAWFAKHGITVR